MALDDALSPRSEDDREAQSARLGFEKLSRAQPDELERLLALLDEYS